MRRQKGKLMQCISSPFPVVREKGLGFKVKRAHQESGDPRVGQVQCSQNCTLRRSRQECALAPASESLTELPDGRESLTELPTAARAMQNNKKGALSAASMGALERISPRESERARSAPLRPACMYTQPPGGGGFFNRATRSPLQATSAAECEGGGVCIGQPVSVPVDRGCATTTRGCAEHTALPAGTYPPWVKAVKCQRERGRSGAATRGGK